MAQNNIESCGPRQLPIAQIQGDFYYIDERLKQFREVTNSHNFIDFNSDEGQKMYQDYYGMKKISILERIINMLKKEGWKEHKHETTEVHGTISSSFYKNEEVITVSQDFCPDDGHGAESR